LVAVVTALAEALLAAQRQAVGSLAKAFVAGTINEEDFFLELDHVGLREEVDQGLLVASLQVVKSHGGEAPKPTGQTAGPKMPEQATEAQRAFIAKLCKEKNVPEPDVIVSKQQAHEIIEALKAGTYNADTYTVPF
jgi:hypothetical protein